VRMANVLNEQKRQQVVALGRLGWPLRRIEDETGVRRETASAYLKAAAVDVRAPRRRRLRAKPASVVSTDSADAGGGTVLPPPGRSPVASTCEPYRELIEAALAQRRHAMAIWQDLVDGHGFPAGYASVMRFVRQLRGPTVPEAHAVIQTAPGEDYGKVAVMLSACGSRRRTSISCSAVAHNFAL